MRHAVRLVRARAQADARRASADGDCRLKGTGSLFQKRLPTPLGGDCGLLSNSRRFAVKDSRSSIHDRRNPDGRLYLLGGDAFLAHRLVMRLEAHAAAVDCRYRQAPQLEVRAVDAVA